MRGWAVEREAMTRRCSALSLACRSCHLFAAIVALFSSVYFELAIEFSKQSQNDAYAGLLTGEPTVASAVRTLAMFALVFAVMLLLLRCRTCVEWALRYRYPLAIGLLAVLVLLEIHGSSINVWGTYLGESETSGLLFGTPRSVRSDEWLVFTPFAFSQEHTGYAAVSDIIRGCATNVTMVYGQPAWSLATVFRPFLWGYLVLGSAKGLSFFWCGRALFLVLATYECSMLLCDGNKKLSAYAAVLVGFAPAVEWWFAVNGIAELFIFGQGLVCALHHLLYATKVWMRVGWACAIAWFLGCFVLVLYPAWQVCLLYVFGFMGLAVFVSWLGMADRGSRVKQALTVVPYLVFALVLVAGLLVMVLNQSWDVIQTTLNTAYPGKRASVGGDLLGPLLNFVFSPLSAVILPDGYPRGVCAGARFISLFPLGLILCIALTVWGVKNRKPDIMLVCLLVPYLLFLVFGLVGFVPILAKLTLLDKTIADRLTLATGYLDIALLVRSLTLLNNMRGQAGDRERGATLQNAARLCLIVLVPLAIVVIARLSSPGYMGAMASVLLAVAWFVLFLPVFIPSGFVERSGVGRWGWMLVSSVLVLVVGFCVNPLQRGIGVIEQSPTLNELESFVKEDPDALWLADSSIEGQELIMVGARSICSVNVYPNLERWYAIDPDHGNEDAYNRYAHITMDMGDSTSFSNPGFGDVLSVVLAPQDVCKLGATYWLSQKDLTEYNSDYAQFVPVKTVGALRVYSIVEPRETLQHPTE